MWRRFGAARSGRCGRLACAPVGRGGAPGRDRSPKPRAERGAAAQASAAGFAASTVGLATRGGLAWALGAVPDVCSNHQE
jgi:hypothetical protein